MHFCENLKIDRPWPTKGNTKLHYVTMILHSNLVLVFSGGKSSNDFLSAKAEMWPFFNVILTYFKNNEKSTLLNISHQTKSKRTLFTIRCDQL